MLGIISQPGNCDKSPLCVFLTLGIIMYTDLGENISGGGKKGIRKKPVTMTNIREQDLSPQSTALKLQGLIFEFYLPPDVCGHNLASCVQEA